MIVNDEQRRALQFIATVNRGGWRPSGREINEWRRNPEPKPRRKGKLLQPEVPAVPERRVRVSGLGSVAASYAHLGNLGQSLGAFTKGPTLAALGLNASGFRAAEWYAKQVAPLLGEYKVIPAKPGRPAVYAPDRPKEKFLAHLRRLGWVERDDRDRYAVTQLGHALLRADALEDVNDEPSVMVLEADNELAYGQVLGVIAECGNALVLDAYLGSEQLGHILKHTSACRFLVGSKLARSRMAELSLLIELTPCVDGPPRELRKADFHDRWVIGEEHVYGLGSSLNGVGKATTTLVQMPDAVASIVRSQAEQLWDEGETIARTRDLEGEDEEQLDDVS